MYTFAVLTKILALFFINCRWLICSMIFTQSSMYFDYSLCNIK
uniref:7TM_GPCR_Srx domain-containing protein n=1 Tax=Heterorhabditis bacteriophora TaxID=37862 RepID=A0A1I7W957_HETBA